MSRLSGDRKKKLSSELSNYLWKVNRVHKSKSDSKNLVQFQLQISPIKVNENIFPRKRLFLAKKWNCRKLSIASNETGVDIVLHVQHHWTVLFLFLRVSKWVNVKCGLWTMPLGNQFQITAHSVARKKVDKIIHHHHHRCHFISTWVLQFLLCYLPSSFLSLSFKTWTLF